MSIDALGRENVRPRCLIAINEKLEVCFANDLTLEEAKAILRDVYSLSGLACSYEVLDARTQEKKSKNE
jgi:hypothetical protein